MSTRPRSRWSRVRSRAAPQPLLPAERISKVRQLAGRLARPSRSVASWRRRFNEAYRARRLIITSICHRARQVCCASAKQAAQCARQVALGTFLAKSRRRANGERTIITSPPPPPTTTHLFDLIIICRRRLWRSARADSQPDSDSDSPVCQRAASPATQPPTGAARLALQWPPVQHLAHQRSKAAKLHLATPEANPLAAGATTAGAA